APRATAQGTPADYARSAQLNAHYDGLAVNVVDRASWIGKTDRFWYRRSVNGGYEFMVVDAKTLEKRAAFDHAKLAASLSSAMGGSYTATQLPFTNFNFSDDESTIDFVAGPSRWQCVLATYTCTRAGPGFTPGGRGGRGGRGGPALDAPPAYFADDSSSDVVPFEGPWDTEDAFAQNSSSAVRPATHLRRVAPLMAVGKRTSTTTISMCGR